MVVIADAPPVPALDGDPADQPPGPERGHLREPVGALQQHRASVSPDHPAIAHQDSLCWTQAKILHGEQ